MFCLLSEFLVIFCLLLVDVYWLHTSVVSPVSPFIVFTYIILYPMKDSSWFPSYNILSHHSQIGLEIGYQHAATRGQTLAGARQSVSYIACEKVTYARSEFRAQARLYLVRFLNVCGRLENLSSRVRKRWWIERFAMLGVSRRRSMSWELYFPIPSSVSQLMGVEIVREMLRMELAKKRVWWDCVLTVRSWSMGRVKR